MADPVYDTHGFVKRLNEAGMPEQQAEVLAAENMNIMTEVLATKDDWRALETKMDRQFAELRAEVAGLRAELKSEMADLRAELKSEMADLRSELKSEMADLRSENASLRVQMAKLENKVDTLENRLLIRLGGLVIAVQAAALVIGQLF